jgi:carbon starvation protein
MNGAWLLLLSALWFVGWYLFYGSYLERLFGTDPTRPTPAHTRQDGVDYVPTRLPVLFGHHFASIAGAGPIVGPVAAMYFGWLPGLLWVLVGCVLVGAFHDFAAMYLSVRDEGRSIGHVIEQQIGYAGRQIFLLFCWAALVLVVTVFAILVAKTFAATPAAATSSVLFIFMSPIFGWLVYRRGMSILTASLIFVPILFALVWVGTVLPLDLTAWYEQSLQSAPRVTVTDKALSAAADALGKAVAAQARDADDAPLQGAPVAQAAKAAAARVGAALTGTPRTERTQLDRAAEAAALEALATLDARGVAASDLATAFVRGLLHARAVAAAMNLWIVLLLIYAAAAAVLPVWLLLQPRDYLNSFLLYAMMIFGFLGVFVAMPGLRMPAFAGWNPTNAQGKPGLLFPLLFVTVACGACSGFHALVSSGTTAKQLASERHIRPVGYGAMLVEGVLAVMAIISVGYLSSDDYGRLLRAQGEVSAFASGIASFGTRVGVPLATGTGFVALAISAFILTTLDTATRLTRFAWQELFLPRATAGASAAVGPLRRRLANPYLATLVVVGAAAYLGFSGEGMTLWPVFGASNQLLAALTLLAVTLYLARRRAAVWTAAVPMVLMLAVSGWALVVLLRVHWGHSVPLVVATLFLLAMAVVLAALAVAALLKVRRSATAAPDAP